MCLGSCNEAFSVIQPKCVVSVEYSTHLQSCLWTVGGGNKGQMMSGKDGVWEVFGRLS